MDGLKKASELCDALVTDMRKPPLVTRSGSKFTFYNRENQGFKYQFDCNSDYEALEWIAHMSEKMWVTIDHIARFSELAMVQARKGWK